MSHDHWHRGPGEASARADAPPRGRTDLWPFWREAYAGGDPLPKLACQVERPAYRFAEGEPLPPEYKGLLMKMLRHEGERVGNKSFLGFMATCLDLAEAIAPGPEAKLVKAEYLAARRPLRALRVPPAPRDVGGRRLLPLLRGPQWRVPLARLARVELRTAPQDRGHGRAGRARPLGDGPLLPRRDRERPERQGPLPAPARKVVSGGARHVRALGLKPPDERLNRRFL